MLFSKKHIPWKGGQEWFDHQEWAAYRPKDSQNKVAMTFFIGCEDPMEEKARSMASSSVAPPSLQDEEITLRI